MIRAILALRMLYMSTFNLVIKTLMFIIMAERGVPTLLSVFGVKISFS